MRLLWGAGGVAAALGVQALVVRAWPAAGAFVDLLLVPVVYYGVADPSRAAIWTGCAGGLLQDVWFAGGTLGLNGFKKTLLAWGLTGVAARLDLNHAPGHFAAGAMLSVADTLVERLIFWAGGLGTGPWSAGELVGRALTTGLASVVGIRLARGVVRRRRGRRIGGFPHRGFRG